MYKVKRAQVSSPIITTTTNIEKRKERLKICYVNDKQLLKTEAKQIPET